MQTISSLSRLKGRGHRPHLSLGKLSQSHRKDSMRNGGRCYDGTSLNTITCHSCSLQDPPKPTLASLSFFPCVCVCRGGVKPTVGRGSKREFPLFQNHQAFWQFQQPPAFSLSLAQGHAERDAPIIPYVMAVVPKWPGCEARGEERGVSNQGNRLFSLNVLPRGA